ncbi:MAG: DUF2085 domain-containing protein [bacterium]
MQDMLSHLFAYVCGQNPAHTWSPGGVWMPCCQRCTGLYVGACVAAALLLAARPTPSYRWRWVHGGFLLLMVPFGFHWLPQGPVLRSVTGVLFGFGLTAYLMITLPVPTQRGEAKGSARTYAAGLLATLTLVPWLGAYGSARAADTLSLLATGGALALCTLALANAALVLCWLIRRTLDRTA